MRTNLVVYSFFVLLATLSCSDDGPASPGNPTVIRYVDGASGSDANGGTKSAPWATISHALSQSAEAVTIIVAAGTYSAATGEVFPLVLKRDQSLIGDTDNRGGGATPTRIRGEGPFALDPFQGATIVGAAGARVAGFAIEGEGTLTTFAAVLVDTVSMEIDHNTLESTLHTGVALANGSDAYVHDNDIRALTYSLYLADAGTPRFEDNAITISAFAIACHGTDQALIVDNTVDASVVCIDFYSGTGTIRGNVLHADPGSAGVAIRIWSGSPTVRSNVFTGDAAVNVKSASGAPDLGTSASRGQNQFAAITGVSLLHEGSVTVMAIGNSWPNNPPVVGTDIVISGSGTVVTQ